MQKLFRLLCLYLRSLMFALLGCLADHGTGSYTTGQSSGWPDRSGGCCMAGAAEEICGNSMLVPAAWPSLSDRCLSPTGRPTYKVINHVQRHPGVVLLCHKFLTGDRNAARLKCCC